MCRFKSVVALDHPNLDRGGDLHPRVAPAVMTLLGDRAWTLPAWLDRALPSISLEGELDDEQRPPQPTGGDRTPGPDSGPPDPRDDNDAVAHVPPASADWGEGLASSQRRWDRGVGMFHCHDHCY